MVGCILKDIYSLKRQVKVIGFVLAIYIVLSVINKDVSFMSFIIVFANIGIGFATFSYDEHSHFNRYAHILPVPLHKQVLARYVESVGVNLVMILISIPLSMMIDETGMSMIELLTVIMIVFSIGVLLIAIMFPLIYKMGIERARVLLFGIVMIGAMGVMLFQKSGLGGGMDWDGDPLLQSILMSLWYLAPLASLVLAGISYFISAHIVTHKEV